MTEESSSGSTKVTISSTDTSSDTPVSFQKPTRSAVWKHFRYYHWSAQCLLCKKVLSYNGRTTSNLIQHLNKKHHSEVEVQKVETTEDTTSKQLSITQFRKLYKGKSISKPCLVETKEEITRILTKWTWKDMRPISIVHDKGLIELLAFLEPNYRPPSTMHVTAQILKWVRLQLKNNCIVAVQSLSPLIYGLRELHNLLQLQLHTSLISTGI